MTKPLIDTLAELDAIEAGGDLVQFLTALEDAWPALREAACRRNDEKVAAPAATKLRLANAIFKHWMESEAFSENAKDDALVLVGIQAAIDYFVSSPTPKVPADIITLYCQALGGDLPCRNFPLGSRCDGCPEDDQ